MKGTPGDRGPADYDPLAHVPDPDDRFQVFAYTRGVEIWVEISVKATSVTLTIPMLDALKIAANINHQLVYAFEGVLKRFDAGTLPEFERLISEWGPHGEGTAEQNLRDRASISRSSHPHPGSRRHGGVCRNRSDARRPSASLFACGRELMSRAPKLAADVSSGRKLASFGPHAPLCRWSSTAVMTGVPKDREFRPHVSAATLSTCQATRCVGPIPHPGPPPGCR